MLCDVIRCCKVLQASLAALVCICHIMSCYAQEHGGPKQAHRDRRTWTPETWQQPSKRGSEDQGEVNMEISDTWFKVWYGQCIYWTKTCSHPGCALLWNLECLWLDDLCLQSLHKESRHLPASSKSTECSMASCNVLFLRCCTQNIPTLVRLWCATWSHRNSSKFIYIVAPTIKTSLGTLTSSIRDATAATGSETLCINTRQENQSLCCRRRAHPSHDTRSNNSNSINQSGTKVASEVKITGSFEALFAVPCPNQFQHADRKQGLEL